MFDKIKKILKKEKIEPEKTNNTPLERAMKAPIDLDKLRNKGL